MKENVLAVILAGGKGERLEPLTRDRAKPAVPFGGGYRIIDFTLSNCFNSGIRKIVLLTQYKSFSLSRHLSLGWSRFFCREFGEFIDILSPQLRIDERWYRGTADAVYQNIYTIEKEEPDYIIVLAGDHIYKMNYGEMLDFHKENQADLTIAALPVPLKKAKKQLGVIEADPENRIIGFEEKPEFPHPLSDRPDLCFASMGIYVFSAKFLFEELCRDAALSKSRHDFGGNIIPRVIQTDRVFAFPFFDQKGKRIAYWRDVGTIDAYYEANMDLISIEPELNIYDEDWPIYTHHPHYPPAKFILSEKERSGLAMDSIVCDGCIISGANVRHSLLGHQVRVDHCSTIEDSILFPQVKVGKNVRIRRAIIEKNASVPDHGQIGYDVEQDRSHGYHITESGLTIVPKPIGF
ncbi:MAG: glucose-1-phosphate adenylyltransferase [Planctomycetia bacterium]|nr:glucose-1-phosphate adenylyltransferase [Planctomycetia bacterium]